ncbi:neprilysin-1-like [Rhipicephalus microplus]|uniref:neprilysin-1-like n=1 Tax=Rhipicephalus microplus TaxID=6941 RepID=UPI003F6CC232
MSDECIRNLQFLDQIMHFGVDPCMAFHSYACGRFMSPTKYMLEKMNHNLATRAYERALEEKVQAYPPTLNAEQKAYKLFHMCLDLHEAKRKQPEALVKVLDELKLNPTSIADDASEDPLDRMMETSFTYGVHGIIEFVVDSVVIIKKKRLLKISVASEEILWHKERKSLVEKNTLAEYYMSRLEAIGVFSSKQAAEDYVPKLAELENAATMHMAESVGLDFRSLLESETVPVKKISKYTKGQVGAGRWLRLLDKYGSYGGNDRVVVQPAGLKFLTRLLSDSGGEGVRQLLSWSLVRQWLPLSDGSLDTEGPLARNVSCVETVLSVLRLPFLAHVLFESVSKDRLTDAKSLARKMQSTFSGMLQNSSMFHEAPRQIIIEKLAKLKVVIGYPEAVNTTKKVDALYEGLALSKSTLFENWLEASKYEQGIIFKDHETMLFDATSAMVFYDAMTHQVIVPAGALLPPLLYSPNGASAYNYGSLGQYIALEMARGLGPMGKNSNYENEINPWVTPVVQQFYDNVKNCLKESWDIVKNDHLPFHNPPDVDSSFVMDTDTAFFDLVGARVAYEAYTMAQSGLQKLSVDPDRLSPAIKQFFVGSCVKWCLDAHSKLVNYAGPFRCVLPLVNIGGFSEAFRCKRSSGYTSMLKCSLL